MFINFWYISTATNPVVICQKKELLKCFYQRSFYSLEWQQAWTVSLLGHWIVFCILVLYTPFDLDLKYSDLKCLDMSPYLVSINTPSMWLVLLNHGMLRGALCYCVDYEYPPECLWLVSWHFLNQSAEFMKLFCLLYPTQMKTTSTDISLWVMRLCDEKWIIENCSTIFILTLSGRAHHI